MDEAEAEARQQNKLWQLNREGQVGWDEIRSGLVRAPSEAEARQVMYEKEREIAFMPSEAHGNWWLDPLQSTCEEVSMEGRSSVLEVNINYG